MAPSRQKKVVQVTLKSQWIILILVHEKVPFAIN